MQIFNRAHESEKKEALEMLHRIDDLLDEGSYAWAEDTLLGIRTTIEKSERVTENQRRAIDNIEYARDRR